MKLGLVVVAAFALAGCGGRGKPLVVVPSADRLDWAAQLGRANAVSDPAAYMMRRLRGFLQRIGYFEPDAIAFVELIDERGQFAWSAGRYPGGGMVHPRPDLDQCSPIGHSQLAGAQPPPCPAD
jgi:hypothetical protein